MSATMRITGFPVALTTTAPLHHGAFGADTGNAVLFRRVPLAAFPDHPGVPAVSGNALRGCLRRIVMRDLLARCGLLPRADDTLSPQQWDKLYAALANGGHLEQAETKTDPDRIRRLRDAVPPLSVFGAALYGYMLPGRLSVGWLWPECAETIAAGLCPSPTIGEPVGAEALLTEVTLTRHIDRDLHDPARSGVTPMPVTVEALMPGVVLHGTIAAQTRMDPTEWSVVGWGLDRLHALGGKGASGFGRVDVAHEIPSTMYDAWLEEPAAIARARDALIALAQAMA
jgi:hypothetical protein